MSLCGVVVSHADSGIIHPVRLHRSKSGTLDKLIPQSQFPHLFNGGNNRTQLMALLRESHFFFIELRIPKVLPIPVITGPPR